MVDSLRGGTRRVGNGVKSAAAHRKREPFRGRIKRHKNASAFLRRKEKLFLAIAKHTPDVIVVVDAQGKILYMNGARSGPREEIALGSDAFVPMRAESRDLCRRTLEKSLATGQSVIVEHPGPHSTWWLARFIPVEEFAGSVPAAVIVCTDITKHERMEEQLIRLNRALRALGRCSEILARSSDENHFLNDICEAIVEVKGYSLVWVGLAQRDEAKTVRPVAHAGFEDGYLEKVNITWARTERGKGPTGTAIRTGKPQVMRDILRDPHYGPWRDEALKRGYASSAALPMISEGKVLGALNVYSDRPDAFGAQEVKLLMELAGDLAYGIKALRNKAERDRLAEELVGHERKLQALTMRLALAEEHERRRIAEGIHDELSQKLVLAKFELQKLGHIATAADISGSLGHLCSRMDEMLEDTRTLTFELSSPALYTLGLSAAVESWLKEHVLKENGMEYDFISDLGTLCLDVEVRVTLFQAIRELVTNVIKHAKAENVKVSIREVGDQVNVAIEDDGVGFNTNEMLESPTVSPTGRFGLFNVRERIEYLGGRFKVKSAPAEGTQIAIRVAKKYCGLH